MKIRNICISNFKSYNEAGTVIKLSDVTGFIGSNSAGKSNILEALELFFHPVKLDSSVFHKKQTDIPICLDITFDGFVSSDNLNAKIMSNSQTITLRRIYKWNPTREQAEPDKNLYLRAMWFYCGSNRYMNPYESFAAPDIKKYLKGSESELFRETTGIPETSTVKEFSQSLIKFWTGVDCSSDMWRDHFRWKVIDDQAASVSKALQDAVNAVVLPEYIYLPINHSISDEMSLKKGSRLDILFSALLKLDEKEQTRQAKAFSKLRDQIDKYHSQFFDKKLKVMNQQLKEPGMNWNFSRAELRIDREEPSLTTLLQPTWKLMADDGYLSEISNKGNGMQRLAVFQLLQIYAEFVQKCTSECNIILAIEEPELYLHPPYKRALYQLFRRLSGIFQIFYTTHDPIFIRLEYFDEIRLVRKNNQQQSDIKCVDWSLFEENVTV